MVYLDFETEAIEPFPNYPPFPVGVAIKTDETTTTTYYSWGHPTENNCTFAEIYKLLPTICDNNEIVMHNAAFDLAILWRHFGIYPKHIHDTMVLAYLHKPYQKSLALKELAVDLLNLPVDSRDELRDWVIANVPAARKAKTRWGAYIANAPGTIVEPYAKDDVELTARLFTHLMPIIEQDGMSPAYQVEMKLIPIMLKNTMEGVRVDVDKLANDVALYTNTMELLNAKLKELLGVDNIDSDVQLTKAIMSKGMGDINTWPTTKTGRCQATKSVLAEHLEDKVISQMLQYRASLGTCLNTFMIPWLTMAEANNGKIHTQWNTTRNEGGGARTGRLSSSPNFQNVPKEFNVFTIAMEDVPNLPELRSYIVADDREAVLVKRDYASQELRVFAHFEDDVMMQKYKDDKNIDIHQFVTDMMNKYSTREIKRSEGKALNFLNLYGGGAGKLAYKLGCSLEEAQELKRLYNLSIPRLKEMYQEMHARTKAEQPVRTLGGRLFYGEEGFSYKLINYLVQGSSADMSKRAIIRYNDMKIHGRLILSVHDEMILSVPRMHAESEMQILKDAMDNAISLDVPVTSDGKVGYKWSEMR